MYAFTSIFQSFWLHFYVKRTLSLVFFKLFVKNGSMRTVFGFPAHSFYKTQSMVLLKAAYLKNLKYLIVFF